MIFTFLLWSNPHNKQTYKTAVKTYITLMSCPKILAKFHKQVNLYESTANANMTFSSSTKHKKYILKTL